ncbi:MAG: allantoate amidohydrolase [Rhodospirillales bacterium]|nr:allantoate amidohydrolase [Rhodospirillales bacterium]
MLETASGLYANLGPDIMRRLDALALFSEDGDGVTRRFATREHRQAAEMIQSWMRDAGMTAHMDAVGNVIGRYEATTINAPALLIGSHQDTVREGGKYDGAMGIVTPITCIGILNNAGERFPFAIEVIAFCDEEGVRFNSTLLGSRAIAGSFDKAVLTTTDSDGKPMAEALRKFGVDPDGIASLARPAAGILGFVELHIEQGPVLEEENLALGVVTAIAGGTRMSAKITGFAGHAGTVPMARRNDALTAAAEAILAIERYCSSAPGLVGTVGRISAAPGAVNVIPGEAVFTIDIRAGDDAVRRQAVAAVRAEIETICARRGVRLAVDVFHESDGCQCAPWLMDQLEAAVIAIGQPPKRLMSGAGHDGMAMARVTDVGMLFVRCKGGISHHPAESITAGDAALSAQTLLQFIRKFEPKNEI